VLVLQQTAAAIPTNQIIQSSITKISSHKEFFLDIPSFILLLLLRRDIADCAVATDTCLGAATVWKTIQTDLPFDTPFTGVNGFHESLGLRSANLVRGMS
jgi:hypothetical protein